MNLLFRADAGLTMGTGHVMRCLALAQACQDAGGRFAFGMGETTPSMRARLASESYEVFELAGAAGSEGDAQLTVELAKAQHADWVVVDGYQFTADYQRALKIAGRKILFLDDYGHADHYFADLVLNQNAQADERLYDDRESYTRLLLGPRYSLLRREFTAWRGWKREIAPQGRKVLVTMGGSDPENHTRMVVEALCRLPDIQATIVVGGSNPHFDELRQATSKFEDRMRLLKGITNMPELMAEADVAVSAAGSTCWEMCLLQLPMVLMDLAENQKPIAGALRELGAALHLGSASDTLAEQIVRTVTPLLASQDERRNLSRRCRELVDGLGAERVIGELTRG